MKIIFKRVLAYLIDIFVVTFISTLLVSNKYININYEKYQKIYENYNGEYKNYEETIESLTKFFNNNKISRKEYSKITKFSKKYKTIVDKYYGDNEITEKEYNNILKEIRSLF